MPFYSLDLVLAMITQPASRSWIAHCCDESSRGEQTEWASGMFLTNGVLSNFAPGFPLQIELAERNPPLNWVPHVSLLKTWFYGCHYLEAPALGWPVIVMLM